MTKNYHRICTLFEVSYKGILPIMVSYIDKVYLIFFTFYLETSIKVGKYYEDIMVLCSIPTRSQSLESHLHVTICPCCGLWHV